MGHTKLNFCIFATLFATLYGYGHHDNSRPASYNRMEEVFKWKQVEFDLSSSSSDSNGYGYGSSPSSRPTQLPDPYNNFPASAMHHKGRLFITTPRRRPGVISTLNVVSTNKPKGSSPKLRPYPDVRTNELDPLLKPNGRKIISVYRPRVDACNRLWLVDTGMLEYPNNRTQVQRPAIWIFNLETDEFVRRYEIPESIVAVGRGMVSITVDADPNQCDNAYAYIPDLVASRIYVYSFAQDKMWSFAHNYFHFDPIKGDFFIDGVKFRLGDGIFSITLGDKLSDGYRNAYFHSMSSTSEFLVSTKILQDEAASRRSDHVDDFKFLGKRARDGQSTTHMYDSKSGAIFFTQVHLSGVACWNPQKPYSRENQAMIATDVERMIYPSDIYVDHDGDIWVLSNRMPRFSWARLDPNEINYRVWRQKGTEAVKGTVCESSRSESTNENLYFIDR